MTLKHFTSLFGTCARDGAGFTLHCGLALSSQGPRYVEEHLPPSFEQVRPWSTLRNRRVWASPVLRAVVTYTGGRVCMIQTDTAEQYRRALAAIGRVRA
jgi:hypothetical protein